MCANGHLGDDRCVQPKAMGFSWDDDWAGCGVDSVGLHSTFALPQDEDVHLFYGNKVSTRHKLHQTTGSKALSNRSWGEHVALGMKLVVPFSSGSHNPGIPTIDSPV